MFGRHNAIRNNREVANQPEEAQQPNQWQEAMSDVKSFDEHVAETTAETEKNPVDLEKLKNFTGFAEQLETMGANQEIISNPAFERIIKNVIFESGLGSGKDLESNLELPEDRALDFSCKRDKSVNTGSNQHDCSRFHINVAKDGNFVVQYAFVDRTKREVSSDSFKNYKVPNSLNKIAAYDDVNSAHQLKFVKQDRADGFNVDFLNCYEEQFAPVADFKNINVGLYHEHSEMGTRRFNASGQETSNEKRTFAAGDYDGLNNLGTFVGISSDWGNSSPERASFNGLDRASHEWSSRKVESHFASVRNPDGVTMSIKAQDRSGEIDTDSVLINSEHGTDDLHVNAAVLAQLYSKSGE